MPQLRLPREYYLKRAVESYEAAGDPRAAAEALARFGTPAASAEAARRYEALGDLPAAGEAYLAAGEPRAALACFERACLPERALACLELLGDAAAQGALLLELGRGEEAAPLLAQALAGADEPAAQVTLRFHLARALGPAAGAGHYRAALAQLERLPATAASAPAWAALGAWGAALGRQDRAQEGYAQALRLLAAAQDWSGWRETARRYQAVAQAMGNRRLAQMLAAALAERAEALPPPPDPVVGLLEAERWEEALAALEPRARRGDAAASALLAAMIEGQALARGRPSLADQLSALGAGLAALGAAPRRERLRAAALLGAVGDPRLLDPRTGEAPLGGYWCAIEAGPFWFGDDRREPLRQERLPYAYRIGRYPVTNAEYGRFIEAGGYQERRWWTEQGWRYLQPGSVRWLEANDERITRPRRWDTDAYNQPNQPVVGVSWYEAAAYCAWLSEEGHQAGWLPVEEVIRLPTWLEWERAARGVDRRRYPWGDEAPDGERANYGETGIGRPTAVGCFPAGAASCGALDMAGNVMEWSSACWDRPADRRPGKDFTPGEVVVVSYSGFGDGSAHLCCGARYWSDPYNWHFSKSFRVLWSLALGE